MFFEYSMKPFFRNFSNAQCSLNLFEDSNIRAKMSRSKFQLSARVKRKNLSLDEKIKAIDYANKNPQMGCRVIVEHSSIRKTCAWNVLRNAKNLQREYEFYKGNCKKARYGHYHVINEILIDWYKKCLAHILESGPMLKEDYKRKIKQRWIGYVHCIKRLVRKFYTNIRTTWDEDYWWSNNIAKMTIQSWIERLLELTLGYELWNIWNWMNWAWFSKFYQKKAFLENREDVKWIQSLNNILQRLFCSSRWFKNFQIFCNLEE